MELAASDFRQSLPGDGTPATESTAAYLSYDDRNLYAAIVCLDEPGPVRAHLANREATDPDNGVGVLLDTFHDFHRAYYFFSCRMTRFIPKARATTTASRPWWDSTGRVLPDGESRNSG